MHQTIPARRLRRCARGPSVTVSRMGRRSGHRGVRTAGAHGGAKRTATVPSAPQGTSLAPDGALVRVALTFFAFYAALQAAVWWLAYRGFLDPFIEATTRVAGACAVATGLTPVIAGNQLQFANRILQIDLDCTGISLAIVFAALVLAYPLGWRTKAVGLALGLPILGLANMARLTAVAHLSARLGDEAFGFTHDYLFMVVMVAVVMALWSAYLTLARRYAARG